MIFHENAKVKKSVSREGKAINLISTSLPLSFALWSAIMLNRTISPWWNVKLTWNLKVLIFHCVCYERKVLNFIQSLAIFFIFSLEWQVCLWWWHIRVKSKLNKLKLNFDNGEEKNFKLSNSNNQWEFGKLISENWCWLKNNFLCSS